MCYSLFSAISNFKLLKNYSNQWPFMHISVWQLECELWNTSRTWLHLLCKCGMWKSAQPFFCVRVGKLFINCPYVVSECTNQCMYVYCCHGFLMPWCVLWVDLHVRVGFVVMCSIVLEEQQILMVMHVQKRRRNSCKRQEICWIWADLNDLICCLNAVFAI